ncbi:hypothetical protein DL770_011602 [Monosporascus sp. CRB-9-2]|nr:hypothetical protein DL770_011602 [Monosporascus sp. CRB-9-2]
MSTSSSPQNPDASGTQDKGPLSSLKLSFLKSLNEKKSTRDGNPPKRRGPKPDSKPALTRRQELNRQAQRTHRERKELYIKALEDEVFRLKEIYSNVAQDKEKLAEENRQLKGLLHQTGTPPVSAGVIDDISSNPSFGYASSNASRAHAPGSSHAYIPSLTSMPTASSLSTPSQMMAGNQMAWGKVSDHPKLAELGPEDFVKLVDELKGKVRRYGFGAVMEESEVRDALNAVLSEEPEIGVS